VLQQLVCCAIYRQCTTDCDTPRSYALTLHESASQQTVCTICNGMLEGFNCLASLVLWSWLLLYTNIGIRHPFVHVWHQKQVCLNCKCLHLPGSMTLWSITCTSIGHTNACSNEACRHNRVPAISVEWWTGNLSAAMCITAKSALLLAIAQYRCGSDSRTNCITATSTTAQQQHDGSITTKQSTIQQGHYRHCSSYVLQQ
jgi:hypothetical protein